MDDKEIIVTCLNSAKDALTVAYYFAEKSGKTTERLIIGEALAYTNDALSNYVEGLNE